jgi:serine/threonine protein phosphatase 1
MPALQVTANEVTRPSTAGRLVYAIGDVHGRLDLLEALVGHIALDAIEIRPLARPLLVLLGDYVDRGPASALVIDFLLELEARAVFELRVLKGNHEDAVLKFLADPAFGETWARFGGVETLASYGVHAPPPGAPPEAWRRARDAFTDALPPAHLAFFQRLELMLEVGSYLFVHAGVAPGRPLCEQAEHDILWIRDEFLEFGRPLEKTVVHGHTPAAGPEIGVHRIGLDTGCYASHVLTGMRLHGSDRAFIQSRCERSLGRPAQLH